MSNFYVFFSILNILVFYLDKITVYGGSTQNDNSFKTETFPPIDKKTPLVVKKTLLDTTHLNKGSHYFDEKLEISYVLLSQSFFGLVLKSRFFEIEEFGQIINEISFKSSDGADSTITKMFNSQTMIALTDKKNNCLFFKKKAQKPYKKQCFSQPVKDVIFSQESELLIALIFNDNGLSITTDGGQTWRKVSQLVSTFKWSPFEDTFYYLRGTDSNKYLVKGKTNDDSTTVIQTKCESLEKVSSYLCAVCTDSKKKLYFITQEHGVKMARFPSLVQPKKFKHVLTSENTIYMVMETEDRRFILYYGHVGQFEFVKVHENIGNPYSFRFDKLCADVEVSESLPGFLLSTTFGKKYTQRRSMVSYDYGQTWRYIIPAKLFDKSECHPNNCSFHIDLSCTGADGSSFTTDEDAPHLMIGHGEAFYDSYESTSGIFVSNDAGLTWLQALADFHMVSIMNQGGVIVAASHLHGSFGYSYDEGKSWAFFDKHYESFNALRIIHNPNSVSTRALIFGYSTNTEDWEIIHVDFTSVFNKKCTLTNYNLFTPGYDGASSCFNGQQNLFYRKKLHELCLGDLNFEKNPHVSTCQCLPKDFRCGFGFVFRDGECHRDPDNGSSLSATCFKDSFEVLKTTKIKIKDDKCKSEHEKIFKEYAEICNLTQYDNIVFLQTRNYFLYRILGKMDDYSLFNLPLTNIQQIQSFDVDTKRRCLYYYAGDQISKICWRTKEEVLNQKTSVLKKRGMVQKIRFNALGRNLLYSTRSELYVLDVISLKEVKIFEYKRIDHFELFETKGFIAISAAREDVADTLELLIFDLATFKVIDKQHISEKIYSIQTDETGFFFICYTKTKEITYDIIKHQLIEDEKTNNLVYKQVYDVKIQIYTNGTLYDDRWSAHKEALNIRIVLSQKSRLDHCDYAPCDYLCVNFKLSYHCLCPEGMIKLSGIECKCTPDKPTCKSCLPSQFVCYSGDCINGHEKCDGHINCLDGSDEIFCNKSCSKYQEFLCRDNQTCIGIEDKCDGTYDCPDFSDELYCKAYETCHIDKFKCDNKNCISKSVVCNGFDNCGDQSDEKICGKTYCHINEFRCKDETCVPTKTYCDGNFDCPDWSDEARCEFTGDIIDVDCAIKCDGKCLPHDKICDHITDCENGIDEIHCGHVVKCQRSEYFNCPLDNLCINSTQLCDGFIDCSDSWDEEDCEEINLCQNSFSYSCKNSHICISKNQVCDGKKDCPGGDDEVGCGNTNIKSIHIEKLNETSIRFEWKISGKDENFQSKLTVYEKKINLLSIKTLTTFNTFSVVSDFEACVQYFVYVSTDKSDRGRFINFIPRSNVYKTPESLSYNRRNRMLTWQHQVEPCVSVYYYVKCVAGNLKYKNFTRAKSIYLDKSYEYCEIASCPGAIMNISCSDFSVVHVGILLRNVVFYKLLISFFVLIAISIIFLGITWRNSFRFKATLRDMTSRLSYDYRPLVDTAKVYHDFLIESPEALIMEDHDDLESVDLNE